MYVTWTMPHQLWTFDSIQSSYRIKLPRPPWTPDCSSCHEKDLFRGLDHSLFDSISIRHKNRYRM